MIAAPAKTDMKITTTKGISEVQLKNTIGTIPEFCNAKTTIIKEMAKDTIMKTMKITHYFFNVFSTRQSKFPFFEKFLLINP